MSRAKKSFKSMRTAELRSATAEFDRELVADSFGEPTASQKQRWASARRRVEAS